MANPILAKKSEYIFDDKFENLSTKELALEIKHYRVGTAPENPSFLANQEECKRRFIEKFKSFFTDESGLELPILISNIGDGKTHFIRMISDAFSNIPNVRVRRVYVRDEQIDIKLKILEAIERSEIKSCVNRILAEYKNEEEYNLITILQEKYDISRSLAITLIKCKSDNLKVQSQAMQLLKGDIDEEFIKTEGLNDFCEKSEAFYFDFLKLLCNYLESENLYIIIVFDEIEHVMDWKNNEEQKRFFRNIKELTDNISTYENIFLILAATEIYMGSNIINQINLIEPATYDRMKSLFIRLKEIESDQEVLNLIMHLKKRYEKFYSIKLDENTVLEKLKQNLSSIRSATTYRLYAQEIIKIFDEYRMDIHNETSQIMKKQKQEDVTTLDKKIEKAKSLWEKAPSSVANKSLMVEALAILIRFQGETIIKTNKRTGFIVSKNNETKVCKFVYIIYTKYAIETKENVALVNEKIKEAIALKKSYSATKCTILVPKGLINKNYIEKLENLVSIIQYSEDESIELMQMLDEEMSEKEKEEAIKKIKMVVL